MAGDFEYDVFLSHSSRDKVLVRALAERLRADGLRVWFDEWELKAGDSIPAKIEEGLERSRVLVLCMSASAFGSDWTQLEAGTFRFRDPLNKDRRFVPLRLDEAPIQSALAQFLYVSWRPEDREQEYAKLLEACRGNVELARTAEPSAFVSTSDSAARVANRPKYYVYVSHSKVEMLYGQLASIESHNAQNRGSTVYSRLAAVVASLRKEPGIISLPYQSSSFRTGYYEDIDRWNMAVLDHSRPGHRTAAVALCMYKDEGNALTLLLGSPSNMIGSSGDQSRHSISPSWATLQYLLALAQERYWAVESAAATLEGSLDSVLFFCGAVCAYMQPVEVNVVFRALYTYRLNAAIWAEVFSNQLDVVFVDKAEHLVIGSPICVALPDNARNHA